MKWYDVVVLLLMTFFAGYGWGSWVAERAVRREQADLKKGRMLVSMPVDPDLAAQTMELLSDFFDQVKRREKSDQEEGKQWH